MFMIFLIIGLFVFIYTILCIATYRKDLLPEYIKQKRHDDWIFPLSYIPRRWTSWVLMMPPKIVFGNIQPRWQRVQPHYPLSPDAELKIDNDKIYMMTPDPMPAPGGWSIQSVKLFKWLPRIPCYISTTQPLFGRNLDVNFGCKPDITWDGPGTDYNWHWAFPEWSITWTKD